MLGQFNSSLVKFKTCGFSLENVQKVILRKMQITMEITFVVIARCFAVCIINTSWKECNSLIVSIFVAIEAEIYY